MKYVSTRNPNLNASFEQALLRGLAPDGGLFVPDRIPELDIARIGSNWSLSALGQFILPSWSVGKALEKSLPDICNKTLSFPTPLVFLKKDTALLELFHGPTCAFKDIGARFLAECLTRIPAAHNKTVLVATSGDTGGAVAAGFFQNPS